MNMSIHNRTKMCHQRPMTISDSHSASCVLVENICLHIVGLIVISLLYFMLDGDGRDADACTFRIAIPVIYVFSAK